MSELFCNTSAQAARQGNHYRAQIFMHEAAASQMVRVQSMRQGNHAPTPLDIQMLPLVCRLYSRTSPVEFLVKLLQWDY